MASKPFVSKTLQGAFERLAFLFADLDDSESSVVFHLNAGELCPGSAEMLLAVRAIRTRQKNIFLLPFANKGSTYRFQRRDLLDDKHADFDISLPDSILKAVKVELGVEFASKSDLTELITRYRAAQASASSSTKAMLKDSIRRFAPQTVAVYDSLLSPMQQITPTGVTMQMMIDDLRAAMCVPNNSFQAKQYGTTPLPMTDNASDETIDEILRKQAEARPNTNIAVAWARSFNRKDKSKIPSPFDLVYVRTMNMAQGKAHMRNYVLIFNGVNWYRFSMGHGVFETPVAIYKPGVNIQSISNLLSNKNPVTFFQKHMQTGIFMHFWKEFNKVCFPILFDVLQSPSDMSETLKAEQEIGYVCRHVPEELIVQALMKRGIENTAVVVGTSVLAKYDIGVGMKLERPLYRMLWLTRHKLESRVVVLPFVLNKLGVVDIFEPRLQDCIAYKAADAEESRAIDEALERINTEGDRVHMFANLRVANRKAVKPYSIHAIRAIHLVSEKISNDKQALYFGDLVNPSRKPLATFDLFRQTIHFSLRVLKEPDVQSLVEDLAPSLVRATIEELQQ